MVLVVEVPTVGLFGAMYRAEVRGRTGVARRNANNVFLIVKPLEFLKFVSVTRFFCQPYTDPARAFICAPVQELASTWAGPYFAMSFGFTKDGRVRIARPATNAFVTASMVTERIKQLGQFF